MIDYRELGEGRPLLLMHGGGEDMALLEPQATAFAKRGRRVIWYDRRGTGASGRHNWPDGGVEQHADDAATLLRSLSAAPATVLGFSSGGVVALTLAARHPTVVTEVIAWEPAAVGVVPGGLDLHAGLLALADAHLAEHPGDHPGAYLAMLAVMSEGRADLESPVVKAALVNAEAMVRDDARVISRHAFAPGDLPADLVTIAVGKGTTPLHAAIADVLVAQLGKPALVVDGADEHEIYLSHPEVLAEVLSNR